MRGSSVNGVACGAIHQSARWLGVASALPSCQQREHAQLQLPGGDDDVGVISGITQIVIVPGPAQAGRGIARTDERNVLLLRSETNRAATRQMADRGFVPGAGLPFNAAGGAGSGLAANLGTQHAALSQPNAGRLPFPNIPGGAVHAGKHSKPRKAGGEGFSGEGGPLAARMWHADISVHALLETHVVLCPVTAFCLRATDMLCTLPAWLSPLQTPTHCCCRRPQRPCCLQPPANDPACYAAAHTAAAAAANGCPAAGSCLPCPARREPRCRAGTGACCSGVPARHPEHGG